MLVLCCMTTVGCDDVKLLLWQLLTAKVLLQVVSSHGRTTRLSRNITFIGLYLISKRNKNYFTHISTRQRCDGVRYLQPLEAFEADETLGQQLADEVAAQIERVEFVELREVVAELGTVILCHLY